MKPIYDAWLIQIEITNACINRCAHCTRAVRHFRTPYFDTIDFVEQSLQSMKGWKRGVGCMGGEPTLHPDFPDICSLYRKYFPRRQCALFTSGGKRYQEYLPLIKENFGILHFHNHQTPSSHHPIMVASEEIVPDPDLRNRLIKECWLQRKWSPAISKKGCFFCEVAAMFDLLFDGPGGYPIQPDWWKKAERNFRDQIEYSGYSINKMVSQKHRDNNHEQHEKHERRNRSSVRAFRVVRGKHLVSDMIYNHERHETHERRKLLKSSVRVFRGKFPVLGYDITTKHTK
jgi:hypothetical protein